MLTRLLVAPVASATTAAVCLRPVASTAASWASGTAATAAAAAPAPASGVGSGGRPRSWDLPTGAWKVSPFEPQLVLYQQSVRDWYRNIIHLSDGGRPLRVGPLERLFSRVRTRDDVDIAVKALNFCRTRFVDFTDTTASKFVHACIRGGKPEEALVVLQRHEKFRMWPTRKAYHLLAIAFAASKDAASVTATLDALLARSDLNPNPQSVYVFARAFSDCDEPLAAVDAFKRFRARGVEANSAALHVLLTTITTTEDLSHSQIRGLSNVLDAAERSTHDKTPALVQQAAAHVKTLRAAIADKASKADGDATEEDGDAAAEASD